MIIAPGRMQPLCKARKAGPGIAWYLNEYPRTFLCAYSFFYVLFAVTSAAKKPFWFDELFTVYLSQLPSFGQVWNAIRDGLELNPPLFFGISWALEKLFGTGHIVSRIPPMFGYWLLGISLFQFVRRRSDAAHGFFAALFPAFTYTAYLAIEARGYAFLLGFSALAMLLWQMVPETKHRLWVLTGIAGSIVILLGSHYYGAYLVGALVMGEMVRSWERRRIDLGVWLALAVGASSLAAYSPLLARVGKSAATFWAAPYFSKFYSSYSDLLTPSAIVLLPAFLLTFVKRPYSEMKASTWLPSPLPASEVVVCATILAMPLVVFCAAFVVPLGFWPRYVCLSVVGLAPLVALFLYRLDGGSGRLVGLVLALGVGFLLTPVTLFRIWGTQGIVSPEQSVRDNYVVPEIPNLPIVIAYDVDFLQFQHYLTGEQKQRVVELLDIPSSVKYLGYDTAPRTLAVARRIMPIPVSDYDTFTRSNPEFVLVRHSPREWIMQRLIADGAELKLVQVKKDAEFETETLIFHVRLPKRTPP